MKAWRTIMRSGRKMMRIHTIIISMRSHMLFEYRLVLKRNDNEVLLREMVSDVLQEHCERLQIDVERLQSYRERLQGDIGELQRGSEVLPRDMKKLQRGIDMLQRGSEWLEKDIEGLQRNIEDRERNSDMLQRYRRRAAGR